MFETDLEQLKFLLKACTENPYEYKDKLHDYKFFENNGAFVRIIYNHNACYAYLITGGNYRDSEVTTTHDFDNILIICFRLISNYVKHLTEATQAWQTVQKELEACL